MPFSSLSDPVVLARAWEALDAAWARIEPTIDKDDRAVARVRLAYMIANLAMVAQNEADLAERATERFNRRPVELLSPKHR